MQNELTINLSDETYQSLMKLVGKQDASRVVEAALRPYLHLAGNRRASKINSPHLVDRSQIERFKVEVVD